jgi:hypothetical protein
VLLNGFNGENIIPVLTYELHDCPITFRFTPLKKGLPCMQASIRSVTNAVTSTGGCVSLPYYECVKPPLTSAAKSPAQPRPPVSRCRRAGIDTRTVDYEVRATGGDVDHDRGYDNDGTANDGDVRATLCTAAPAVSKLAKLLHNI